MEIRWAMNWYMINEWKRTIETTICSYFSAQLHGNYQPELPWALGEWNGSNWGPWAIFKVLSQNHLFHLNGIGTMRDTGKSPELKKMPMVYNLTHSTTLLLCRDQMSFILQNFRQLFFLKKDITFYCLKHKQKAYFTQEFKKKKRISRYQDI